MGTGIVFLCCTTEYEEKSLKKRWKEEPPAQMRELYTVLGGVEDWSA